MTRTLLGAMVAAALLVPGASAAVPGLRATPRTPSAHGARAKGPTPPETGARAVPDAPPAAGAVRYSAPLPEPLRVVRGFNPPRRSYGAGHLGVDLGTTAGHPVRSAAAGRVIFAGRVAGRGVIVVAHADGVRTEYEPVRPTVRVGRLVRRGQVIGRVSGVHGSCTAGRCLHWGARRGNFYLDPLSLLEPLGPVRLLPWTPTTALGAWSGRSS